MDPFRRIFGHAPANAGGIVPTSSNTDALGDTERQDQSRDARRWEAPPSLRAIFTPQPSAAARAWPLDDPLAESEASISPSGYLAPAAMRRSRLDESAGEGLRRSVLVRNAMLSSLEREREGMSGLPPSASVPSNPAFHSNNGSDSFVPRGPAAASDSPRCDREHFEREVQWFEDLFSELSSDEADGEEDDFVAIEAPHQDMHVPALAPPQPCVEDMCPEPKAMGLATTNDSGFAEAPDLSLPSSSCSKLGYPHVCPYPATGMAGSTSSEELPALVEDDSDAEEDDEDEDEMPLAEPDCSPLSQALLSRPISPINALDFEQDRAVTLLSPPSTRPCSPTASASSKADSEHSSPAGVNDNLPSLALLSGMAMRPASNHGLFAGSLDLAMVRLIAAETSPVFHQQIVPPDYHEASPWHLIWHVSSPSSQMDRAVHRASEACCPIVEGFPACPPSGTCRVADAKASPPSNTTRDATDSISLLHSTTQNRPASAAAPTLSFEQRLDPVRQGRGIVTEWSSSRA